MRWPAARRWWLLLRRLAVVAVLVAIALRVGDLPAPRAQARPALEVVLAIDRTTSMSALDGPTGARLDAVRDDLGALVDDLPTARFSVVTFGARAETVVPFTTDTAAIDAQLEAIAPEAPTLGNGSSIGRPVGLLRAVLGGAQERQEDRRRLLVLASDGENTAPGPPGTYAPLAPLLDATVVLGYGTRDGARMPLPVDDREPGEGEFIVDPATGDDALSRLDPATLRTVAGDLGGRYVPRNAPSADPAQMAAVAARLSGAAYADLAPAASRRDVGWAWSLLLLALLVPELRLGWRSWLGARREARTRVAT